MIEAEDIRGVKVAFDRSIVSERVLDAVRRGSYEHQEAQHLGELIDHGERLVELGGGIGLISATAGLLEKAASITVFEADPQLIPIIEETHRLNGIQATVRNAAVVSKADTATLPFFVHRDLSASSLFGVPPQALVRTVIVPTVEFRSVLEEFRPTMLIVDVEGSEADLLGGANLPGVDKIIVEIHPEKISPREVMAIFDRMSAENLVYDPRYSSGQVILFRRLE